MIVNENFEVYIDSIWFEKPKLLKILEGFNYDYPCICRMRAICTAFRNLVDEQFQGMLIWQERSLKVQLLHEKITQSQSKIPNNLESNYNCSPKVTIAKIGHFAVPIKTKRDSLDKINKDRLENTCKCFRTLFDKKNPVTKLLGGYYKIMEIPETGVLLNMNILLEPIMIAPIVKSCDEEGNLFFRIKNPDENNSHFELRISKWEWNQIHVIKGKGYTRLCQNNQQNIKLLANEKLVESKKIWTPLWVLNHKKIQNKCFAFGLNFDKKNYQRIENIIKKFEEKIVT